MKKLFSVLTALAVGAAVAVLSELLSVGVCYLSYAISFFPAAILCCGIIIAVSTAINRLRVYFRDKNGLNSWVFIGCAEGAPLIALIVIMITLGTNFKGGSGMFAGLAALGRQIEQSFNFIAICCAAVFLTSGLVLLNDEYKEKKKEKEREDHYL